MSQKILTLDNDLCDQCHKLGSEIAADQEGAYEWCCVGEIIMPEEPKDLHEELNSVRFCLLRGARDSKIFAQEWTTYETSRVAMALIWAVSNDLIKDQPKMEEETVDESIKRIINENKETLDRLT